ncbi:MAG: ATP-binding protein [Bacteroidetes bacterium]|nr:ATP-binding protein [Bacteroidota bacterium]
MSSVFLKDRGPAEYFHGRKEIIDTFNGALELFRDDKDGTTFMIQGAPGAGKTALLDVLSTQAKSNGWEVADIAIEDLYNPASMAQSLGEAYLINSEIALKAGITFIEGQVVGHVAGHATPKRILKRVAPEYGLILVLDEAQRLNNISDGSESHIAASDTLDVIHNGKLKRPVLLLTAGLGTTEAAYGSLGISRFMRKCRVHLGCLSHESTCAVIRDFLFHKGGVSNPPLQWIETIAERTHGWPQHIISYADPAAKYLASHQTPNDEGLHMVLQQGRAEQIEYYKIRVKGIDKKKRQILAKFFANVPLGETIEFEDIMSVLESEYPPEVAEALFNKALERGIIDEREDGDYGIPIPSFHSWLVDEYAKGKDKGRD